MFGWGCFLFQGLLRKTAAVNFPIKLVIWKLNVYRLIMCSPNYREMHDLSLPKRWIWNLPKWVSKTPNVFMAAQRRHVLRCAVSAASAPCYAVTLLTSGCFWFLALFYCSFAFQRRRWHPILPFWIFKTWIFSVKREQSRPNATEMEYMFQRISMILSIIVVWNQHLHLSDQCYSFGSPCNLRTCVTGRRRGGHDKVRQ